MAVLKLFGNDLSVLSRINTQALFSYLHSIILPSYSLSDLTGAIFENGASQPPTNRYPIFFVKILKIKKIEKKYKHYFLNIFNLLNAMNLLTLDRFQ